MSEQVERWARVLVATIVLSVATLVTPRAAVACACGAVSSSTTVSGEVALIAWDGAHQTTDMVMRLTGSTKDAAWIMPTPADATLGLGRQDVFAELDDAVRPRIEVRKVFRLSEVTWPFSRDGGPRAGASGDLEVVSTTDVGPYRITTLRGAKASAVNAWLIENGYPSRPELEKSFQSYLDQGWVIQAVKLTPKDSTESFYGNLPPLRMSFPTTAPIYPIRLSGQAKTPQRVRLYVVAKQPMSISRQASSSTPLTLIYSGNPALEALHRTDLAAGHLTAYEGTLDPATITHDVEFRADPSLQDYRRVEVREQNVANDLLPTVLIIALLFGPAVVIWLIVRRVTRRATASTRPPA